MSILSKINKLMTKIKLNTKVNPGKTKIILTRYTYKSQRKNYLLDSVKKVDFFSIKQNKI